MDYPFAPKVQSDLGFRTLGKFWLQDKRREETEYPRPIVSIQRESTPQIAQPVNISTSKIEPAAPTVFFSTPSPSAIGAEGWKELDELWNLTVDFSETSTVTAQNPLTDSVSTPPQSSAAGVSETLVLPVKFGQIPSMSSSSRSLYVTGNNQSDRGHAPPQPTSQYAKKPLKIVRPEKSHCRSARGSEKSGNCCSMSIGAAFIKDIEKELAGTSSQQQPVSLKRAGKHYQCNKCNGWFKSKSIIYSHINAVHLGIKEHGCQYCGRFFAKIDTLKTHVRVTHTKEKPYNCPFCDECFKCRQHLAYHKTKVHKKASAKKPKTK